MSQAKINVLTFVNHYLPGYKGGGPIRTIANMVDHLGDEFSFWIVTQDRDFGDTEPYAGIELNSWRKIGNANVFYTSPEKITIKNITKLINSTPCDAIYLNSFFDQTFTIKALLARKISKKINQPVILAPRGELSGGALRIKKAKKTIYMAASKILNLYQGITFHASSSLEAEDISLALKANHLKIKVALNPPPKHTPTSPEEKEFKRHPATELKIIFLSRISPKKNLEFALEALRLTSQKIIFDIYGPKEDIAYWEKCQALINRLPDNVLARYCGSVPPENIKNTFSDYDLFLFPTLGENYGHVIAESLSCGTPVLLSDQTPWANMDKDKLGWDLPLKSPRIFAEKIDQLSKIPFEMREAQRSLIQERAAKRLLPPETIEANREIFRSALTCGQ